MFGVKSLDLIYSEKITTQRSNCSVPEAVKQQPIVTFVKKVEKPKKGPFPVCVTLEGESKCFMAAGRTIVKIGDNAYYNPERKEIITQRTVSGECVQSYANVVT